MGRGAVLVGLNIDGCIIAGFPKGPGNPDEGDVGSPINMPCCGCGGILVPGVTGDNVDSGGVGYEVAFAAVTTEAVSTQLVGPPKPLFMKTTSARS